MGHRAGMSWSWSHYVMPMAGDRFDLIASYTRREMERLQKGDEIKHEVGRL